jgi:hypothetical protein
MYKSTDHVFEMHDGFYVHNREITIMLPFSYTSFHWGRLDKNTADLRITLLTKALDELRKNHWDTNIIQYIRFSYSCGGFEVRPFDNEEEYDDKDGEMFLYTQYSGFATTDGLALTPAGSPRGFWDHYESHEVEMPEPE